MGQCLESRREGFSGGRSRGAWIPAPVKGGRWDYSPPPTALVRSFAESFVTCVSSGQAHRWLPPGKPERARKGMSRRRGVWGGTGQDCKGMYRTHVCFLWSRHKPLVCLAVLHRTSPASSPSRGQVNSRNSKQTLCGPGEPEVAWGAATWRRHMPTSWEAGRGLEDP